LTSSPMACASSCSCTTSFTASDTASFACSHSSLADGLLDQRELLVHGIVHPEWRPAGTLDRVVSTLTRIFPLVSVCRCCFLPSILVHEARRRPTPVTLGGALSFNLRQHFKHITTAIAVSTS
jgi:hypothetical protein